MGAAEETADFAALLRELKQRSGLSYEALAKRAHMSTSTLHRYCKGEGVPADYTSVSRFARVCKATPEEMVDLHRRWVMADAARERARRAAAAADSTAGPPAEAGRNEAPGPDAGPGFRAVTASGAGAVTGPAAAGHEVGPAAEPEAGAGPVPVAGAGPLPEAGAAPGREEGPGAGALAGLGAADEPVVVATAGSEGPPGTRAEVPPETGVSPQGSARRRGFFRKRRVVVAASTLAVVALTTAVLESLDAGADPGGRPRAATVSTGSWEPQESASPSPSVRPSRSTAAKPPGVKPSASKPAARGGAASADNAPGSAAEEDSVPLTVSARAHDWEGYCGTFYLADKPPAQVPLPPATLQDAPKWVGDAGAVASGRHRVSLAVQGTGDKAVVIESLDVRVVGSGAPLAWNAYEMGIGCGGGVEPREFGLDLDAARPAVRPKGGQRGFPYSVSQSDPEVLYVTAHTDTRDVQWYLVLEWSSGGRQGTIEITDGGKPFRTTSMTGRPLYGYLPGSTEWETQEPQQ
ncbi:helix-turn-helix domain-containing protein [Streptomyces olindensis]|uniref:transcriptional regulator n=1 Tax=Streptomyces olindensis TaxID=358823 RepID=UPI003684CD0F